MANEDNDFSAFNGVPQRWDLLHLFPEAREAAGDTFALKRITDKFLLACEAKIDPLGQELREAIEKRDAQALLGALQKRVNLQVDIVRLDGFMTLLQAEHYNQQAIQKMQGQGALASSLLKDALEAIDRPLRALPDADKRKLLEQAPALKEYESYFSPLDKRLYEGRSFEQVDKIQADESSRRQYFEALYKRAHESGSADRKNPNHVEWMDAALNARMAHEHQVANARRYANPLAMFADRNGVAPFTAANMLNVVPEYYPVTYHALRDLGDNQHRTRWEAIETLGKNRKLKRYTWEEAKQLVIEAFAEFHPEMGSAAAKAFAEGWIHAEPKVGKTSSQFTYMPVPQSRYEAAHPYVSINFDGTIADVVTLAHEMSHAVANHMAGAAQRERFHASVMMHECFATLGEKLIIRKMHETAPDALQHFLISAHETSKSVKKIAKTIQRARFEYGTSEVVKDGAGGFRAASHEEINGIYDRELRALYGPHYKNKPGTADGWMNDSDHIINNYPYYNITYAMSECVGSALMDKWQAAEPQQKAKFAEAWVGLMKAGGTVQFSQAMEQLGLPVNNPEFIHSQLQRTAQRVTQLDEEMYQVPLLDTLRQLTFREKVHVLLHVLDKKLLTPLEKKWKQWFHKENVPDSASQEAMVAQSRAVPAAAMHTLPPSAGKDFTDKEEDVSSPRFTARLEAQRAQGVDVSAGISA